jgi:hypothetical protein
MPMLVACGGGSCFSLHGGIGRKRRETDQDQSIPTSTQKQLTNVEVETEANMDGRGPTGYAGNQHYGAPVFRYRLYEKPRPKRHELLRPFCDGSRQLDDHAQELERL